jgi:hypothetical protein
MKNLKLMCIAFLVSASTIAQKTSKINSEKNAVVRTEKADKITFPPNAFNSSKQIIKLVGTTENGVIIETDKGETFQINTDNTVTKIESLKSSKPRKIKIRLIPVQLSYKTVGTTDDGTQVWASDDGKNMVLDLVKGEMVDYVGHVTLLR